MKYYICSFLFTIGCVISVFTLFYTPHLSLKTYQTNFEKLDFKIRDCPTLLTNNSSPNFYQKFYSINWANISIPSAVVFFTPYLTREPTVQIDETCKAEKLQKPHSASICDGKFNRKVFTGKLRIKPVGKIIHSVKFSFDVDMLEIHLNELYDVIDYFVIVESVIGHAKHIKKPLLWEVVKNQPRFAKFESKIVHFILDDSDVLSKLPENGLFGLERLEEQIRWTKLKNWIEYQKFPNDTLIGFGDSDEITSRQLVYKMRYCELKVSVFDIGIWFSFGDIQTAFKSDFPIIGLPYSFAGASFWTLAEARRKIPYPSYRRGLQGSNALLGGQHLTHYNYLPFLLTKAFTITDGLPTQTKTMENLAKLKRIEDPTDAYKNILSKLNSMMKGVSASRFRKVEELIKKEPIYKEVVLMPWFLKCNPSRYPAWFQKTDPRLLF